MLQEDINIVERFFVDWQLRVNVDKCDVVHLGFNNVKFNYEVCDTRLSPKPSCRDLGIVISDDNKMSKHCVGIVRNA